MVSLYHPQLVDKLMDQTIIEKARVHNSSIYRDME